jgi:hypothetical protein
LYFHVPANAKYNSNGGSPVTGKCLAFDLFSLSLIVDGGWFTEKGVFGVHMVVYCCE